MSAIFAAQRSGSKGLEGRWPRTTSLLLLATLVSLSACRRAEEAPVAEVRPVRVMTIESRSVGDSVSLTGRLQAQTEANESFRIDGRLVERNVDVGDRVRVGQVLARLDSMNEDSNLQSARAQLAAAQAQGVQAESSYQRMRDLVAENAVSRAQFEQAEALQKVARSQIESAQSLVAIAQNRLSYTQLIADVAGVVVARGPEPGEVVPAGRMIVQVAREGAVDAVFDVPASIKDAAPANADITITLAGDPKVSAIGKVREVSPRADPVTGTFQVRVRVVNPPPQMRLGSTVTGRMKLDRPPALDIPASALIRVGGQPAVWLVDSKAGTVSVRNVELRAYDAERVQVASGLAPGDVIVTAGVQALRPGQKVRTLEARK